MTERRVKGKHVGRALGLRVGAEEAGEQSEWGVLVCP